MAVVIVAVKLMSINQSFAVAMHSMCVIAVSAPQSVSAVYIGEQISVHPVVVRRALGRLVEAELLSSYPGSKGGYALTVPAKKISLHDVFRSMQDSGAFGSKHGMPKASCHEGILVEDVLTDIYNQVDDALTKVLKRVSLADVIKRALANA